MKKRGKFFEIGAPTAVGLLKASPAPRTSISNPVSDFAGLAPLRRVCIKTAPKDQAGNSVNLRNARKSLPQFFQLFYGPPTVDCLCRERPAVGQGSALACDK